MRDTHIEIISINKRSCIYTGEGFGDVFEFTIKNTGTEGSKVKWYVDDHNPPTWGFNNGCPYLDPGEVYTRSPVSYWSFPDHDVIITIKFYHLENPELTCDHYKEGATDNFIFDEETTFTIKNGGNPPKASIIGYVKDELGNPLEGVTITWQEKSTLSDSGGFYQIKGYGKGLLVFSKEGYEVKGYLKAAWAHPCPATSDIVSFNCVLDIPLPDFSSKINVYSTPSEADVYLNENPIGKTPLENYELK